jgi:O-antigen/teichoic acid export membrane protein
LGIVLGVITSALIEMVLSFIVVSPKPLLKLNLSIFKNIIKRGKWMTASGILDYLYHNADNIAVGRFLGSTALGIYDMAYSISYLPISEIGDVVSKITLPVYIKISEDKVRLKAAFYKIILTVSAVVIPIGLVFAIFPKEIITVILGVKWISATEVLRVLALFGPLRTIEYAINSLLLSLHRQDLASYASLISFLGMAVVIIPLVMRFGLIGAAYSALLGTIVSFPFYLIFVKIMINKIHEK